MIIDDFVIKRWMDTCHPDAIICQDNRVPALMRKFGFSVPEDLGIAHLNLKADTQGWSGVDQHWEKIGELAMETLDLLVCAGQFGQSRHPILRAIPGTWVEGETTRRHEPPVYQKDRYVERWIRERGDAVMEQ